MALAPVPQTVGRRRWSVVFAVLAVKRDPILWRLPAFFGPRTKDQGERIVVRGSPWADRGAPWADRGAPRADRGAPRADRGRFGAFEPCPARHGPLISLD